MDDDDIKVCDDEDGKTDGRTRPYTNRGSGGAMNFIDSDEKTEDGTAEVIYDDLDDALDEYLNEDDAYSEEEYTGEETQYPTVNSSVKKSYSSGKPDKADYSNGDKFKVQEAVIDDDVCEAKHKGRVSSRNVSLKRSLHVKADEKKQFDKKFDSNLFKRIASKTSERLDVVSSSVEKKRRSKRSELGEDEVCGSSHAGFFENFQKKMIGKDAARMRHERKTEDVSSEDVIESKLQEMENIPPSVTNSLRKILQMTAHTPEEKYKVLDARDKLYKIMRDKDPAPKHGALVGTCPDMCPEKERLQREFQCQVSMFEMVNYPKNTSLNHNHAVKQYCRSSADQEEPLPHELRPVSVLTMTMSHLLHNVADRCELSDDNLGEWYMFMWDRTRALRKELTQQGVCNLDTVKLVEQCARFHIHCAERLVDQDSSIYDDKINTENLTKCLQTLKYMYKDLANEDIYCPNESEFVCYSLLLNLNNTSVFTVLSDMSERVMSSEPVQFALDVMSAWETQNYVRFFNLVNRTTYLNCCILRRYFNEMRLYATMTMIRSYCTKNYSPQIPVYRFVDNLSFEGVKDCCDFLSRCNFDLHENNDVLFVNFNRLAFRNPETPFPSNRAYVVIEEKKKRPFSEVMAGGELPAKTFESHVPQNSFAPNGELKLDSLLCKDLMDFANASSGAAPAAKGKPFEAKVEVAKPPKDPQPFFSDVFGKAQRPSQDAKDVEKTEKAPAGEQPLFPKIDEKGAFGAGASIFGHSFGSNAFFSNVKSDASATSLFGSAAGDSFPSVSAQAPAFKPDIFAPNQSIFGKPQLEPFANKTADEGIKFKPATPPPPPPPQLQPQPPPEQKPEDESNDESDEEKDEESESKKRKEEEEEKERLRSILIEAVARSKKEAERREKERMEAEERERRERERREKERKKRLEELDRQEQMRKAELLKLEELARVEEEKRKSKLKIDKKMVVLKEKYIQWKVREFLNKWRLRTWVSVENRKMKEYFKEVHVRYPPVCTEEHLNGNPYGLVIPNVLVLRKCQKRKDDEASLPGAGSHASAEPVSCINVTEVAAKPLAVRAKRLCNKVEPFLWKVVVSVPDESESSSWRDVETFVEMNFVEDHRRHLVKEKAPLLYREGCHNAFRYRISVRRLRGMDLFEGDHVNPAATSGSNCLIFVMTDDCDVTAAKQRLRSTLLSRPQLPQIPLIVFALGERYAAKDVEASLDLRPWLDTHISDYHVEVSSGRTKQELVSGLVTCLRLAAEKSSPVTMLRVLRLSDFCRTKWFESVWLRMETGLSDYKIILKDPNFLIECYNSCVDELVKIFLDDETAKQTVIGDEFVDAQVTRPRLTASYTKRLSETFERLKLPHWPREIPKSSHQLKYRIHQYCKKVSGEKDKMKRLKWLLYRIIRRHLLWKGLDIYCDEDIDSILSNFPWTQLFQEISRFLVQQLIDKIKSESSELSVMYSVDRIDGFSYESSLISKFLGKSKRLGDRRIFAEASSTPRLEHDSIVFAYTAALARETNKRKRPEVGEENLQGLFEIADYKRQLLDEEPENGIGQVDVHGLKSNFQNLSDRLDELKKRMDENARVLRELEDS